MKFDEGELSHITQLHLIGYRINDGDLTNMTPLQKIAVNVIANEILKWKSNNKPFVVI